MIAQMKRNLSRKIGPLPGWAWLLLGDVASLVGYTKIFGG